MDNIRDSELFNMNDIVECSVEGGTIPIHKSISKTAFVAEINTLRLPLFLYSNIDKELADKIKEKKHVGESKEFLWIDSKGQQKALTVKSTRELPRKFEADVFYALIGLFIKQHAPFDFNYDKKKYNIGAERVDFTWYQLCNYMNITACGANINKLKDSIRIIHSAHYSSDCVFYDKEKSSYYNKDGKSMTLINSYHFRTKHNRSNDEITKTSIKQDLNYVVFDNFILNNISFEYFKYLDKQIYFQLLPSGLSRGLYAYLEANRYNNNNESLPYLKRSFQTLSAGIPIDYKYTSELKRRLNLNLEKLKKIGYIKDWVYSKELNEADEFIYFCFSIDKEGLKTLLKQKKEQKELSDDGKKTTTSELYLKMPELPLEEELIKRGVESIFANKSVGEKDKWYIIKSILWIDKQKLNKPNLNTGALLAFALRNDIEFKGQYEEIEDFVNNVRTLEEKDIAEKKESIDTLYNKYVNDEIKKYKETDEYHVLAETWVGSLDDTAAIQIVQCKKNNQDYHKYEEYLNLRTDSTWFNELLAKELRMMGIILTKEEFVKSNYNNV